MSELEDPELTSSYEHTKITIIYRATIDEKDQKPSKKIFSTTKNIKKEPQDGKERWKCNIVKTLTPRWATHKQENNFNCRDSSQGARDLNPTLGFLIRKTSPPELPAL